MRSTVSDCRLDMLFFGGPLNNPEFLTAFILNLPVGDASESVVYVNETELDVAILCGQVTRARIIFCMEFNLEMVEAFQLEQVDFLKVVSSSVII